MLRCQFLCHVLKALFFIKIALKLSYFCKKCKIFERWGFHFRPPCLRRLRALSPDPQPSEAGALPPHPHPDPQNSPHCEFLAKRLLVPIDWLNNNDSWVGFCFPLFESELDCIPFLVMFIFDLCVIANAT